MWHEGVHSLAEAGVLEGHSLPLLGLAGPEWLGPLLQGYSTYAHSTTSTARIPAVLLLPPAWVGDQAGPHLCSRPLPRI